MSSSTPKYYAGLIGQSSTPIINKLLGFYLVNNEDENREIWAKMAQIKKERQEIVSQVPEDELVEDAGLEESAMSGSEY